MQTRPTRWITMLAMLPVLAALGLPAPALAQAPDRESLRKAFEARHPLLSRLTAEARVGETWEGFVALLAEDHADDPEAKHLVDAENADRIALYRLIAADLARDLPEAERPLMTPRVVAERNGVRNFQRAGQEERLRVGEGNWVTKAERPWLLSLLELESRGRIGEGRDGYAALVRPEDADNARLARIVSQENEARRALYEARAAETGRMIAEVARAQAERIYESLHIGVPRQREDGRWEPTPPS